MDEGAENWLKAMHKAAPCYFADPPALGGACVTLFQESPNYLPVSAWLGGETTLTGQWHRLWYLVGSL